MLGSHGASKRIRLVAFPTPLQAANYVCNELMCRNVVGLMGCCAGGYDSVLLVEDESQLVMRPHELIQCNDNARVSRPIHSVDFEAGSGSYCFVVSKEKSSLPLSLGVLCTEYVHVPHAAWDGIPLLDYQTSLSIVLNEFCTSVGFSEHRFEGQKFQVQHIFQGSVDEKLRAERASEKEKVALEKPSATMNAIFDDNGDY